MAELDFSNVKNYLESLAKRVASLEVKAENLEDELDSHSDDIDRVKRELKDEVFRIKKESKQVKKRISKVSNEINNVISDFKTTARKNSLERLQNRVEDFNPESLATRDYMKKKIDEVSQ